MPCPLSFSCVAQEVRGLVTIAAHAKLCCTPEMAAFQWWVTCSLNSDPVVWQENLKLPGTVTSRINLWISRTQEPSKDGRVKVSDVLGIALNCWCFDSPVGGPCIGEQPGRDSDCKVGQIILIGTCL